MTTVEKLQEAVLAYLYGDGEEDPGEVVAAAAAAPEVDVWLAELDGELRVYKRAVGADPDRSEALDRLTVLREEIARYRQRPATAPTAAPQAAPPAPISLAARRREKRRTYAFVGTLAALAAGILIAAMALQAGPSAPVVRPTVAQAQRWVDELAPGGFGFAGEGPSAHDRGFLLGIARDLSAPHADGTGAGAEELEAARAIALQALAGLGYGEDPDDALKQVTSGCAAFLKDPKDVSACDKGVADYERHRDAALALPKDE